MYYALQSVYYAPVYYALDTMHFNRCTNAVYLILCVLDPMYFSEGLCTEEPFAMPSGTREQPLISKTIESQLGGLGVESLRIDHERAKRDETTPDVLPCAP